ncbi:unnamed protein product [Mytilus coruscus]|uniref:Integrase catalytic domain-containing protein n=1 Tax=Mytilus coruscus TaxID=42192 RepID=A0A6J8EPQ2_MYTCO|nr:unnamed protein product [Mytilus coruscus]
MAFPKDEGEFYLDTDASDIAIGAVLSQMQDGQLKVISYGSRTINKAEKNYCVTDKELLAVRHFVEYYRQYLLGRKFCVRTDHQALIWLFSLKEPKGRVARWLEILSPFNFSVEYRPGIKHGNADAMSRCHNPRECDCSQVDNLDFLKCGPCKKCHKRAIDMDSSLVNLSEMLNQTITGQNKDDPVPSNEIITAPICKVKTRQQEKDQNIWTPWEGGHSETELHKMQENDPDLGPLLKWKESGHRPTNSDIQQNSAATRHYWHIWDSIVLINGLLYKNFSRRDGVEDHTQFLVPFLLKREILEKMHNSILSGHLGKKKTKAKLSQRYYWYEMREDIDIWISQCDICGANKHPHKSSRAPLGTMPVGAPLDRLATDFLGPLPTTPRGNKFILTVTDYFTKWVEVFPVKDQTAVVCAQLILNEVICRFGSPLAIHSDQGRAYESQIFQELCKILEIRKTRTSPRNPKCNGQTERFNRSIISMIKSYLRGEQTNWDMNLGCLAGAYRASPNESTCLTPNILMLGREVRLPYELLHKGHPLDPNEADTSWGNHALKIKERMQRAHCVARKHLEVTCKRRKDYYDNKTNLYEYKVSDKVWYRNEIKREGICPKLQPLFIGPCLVTKKINDLNYEIQIDAHTKRKVVNHDKLKPYYGQSHPKWIKKFKV